MNAIASGACEIGVKTARSLATIQDNAATCPANPKVNASKQNSIYGASDTVQPKGLYVQALIRYE